MASRNKSRAPWHQWAIRLGWALVLALALAYMPYRFMGNDPTKKNAPQLRSDLRRTNEQIEVMQRENARLRQEIHALRSDPTAIEDIARDQLGFVKPTDLVIRIVDKDKGIQ